MRRDFPDQQGNDGGHHEPDGGVSTISDLHQAHGIKADQQLGVKAELAP